MTAVGRGIRNSIQPPTPPSAVLVMSTDRLRSLAPRTAALTALLLACISCSAGDSGGGPTPPAPVTTLSVTVVPATLTLTGAGATGTLTATVTTSVGVASAPTVAWTSSNTAVATVSGSGATATVTTVAPGSATITATSGGQSGSTSVTVNPPITTQSVVIAPATLNLTGVGTTGQLTATVNTSAGVATNPTVTWSSSNAAVATVSATGTSVTVTAVSVGTATIVARAGGVTASIPVTVVPGVEVISVSISPAGVRLSAVGDRLTVTASVRSATGPISSPSVAWSSANSSVVSITGSGSTATIAAVALGTTTIRAIAGGITASVVVTVGAASPTIPSWSWHDAGGATTHGAFGAGRWVAASADGGFFTSSNGTSWQRVPNVSFDAAKVVWTGTRFVAVGQGAMWSADGLTWSLATGGIGSARLDNALWTGTRVIATDSRTGSMFTSADGTSWQNVATVPLFGVTQLAWSGRLLVGLAGGSSSGEFVYVSSDTGRTWTQSQRLTTLGRGRLIWNGTAFVIWGGNSIAISPDGLAWSTLSTNIDWVVSGAANASGFGGVEDLLWTGDRYLAISATTFDGVVLGRGVILTSTNGRQWTEVNTGPHGTLLSFARSDDAILAFGSATLRSTLGATWSMHQAGVRASVRSQITWSIDRFVAVERDALLVSRDGVAWERLRFGRVGSGGNSPFDANAVATWTGQNYVVVGRQGSILTSSDGVTWTTRASGTSSSINRMVWAGGRLVATDQNGRVLVSADGSSWSTQLVTRTILDLAWTGQRFVITAGDTTATSVDGLTWQKSPRLSDFINRLVPTESGLVGIGNNVLQSTDGISWIPVGRFDNGDGRGILRETIARVGNVFVACQVGQLELLYSSDAVQWSRSPAAEPIQECESLSWSGRTLLVGGRMAVGTIR